METILAAGDDPGGAAQRGRGRPERKKASRSRPYRKLATASASLSKTSKTVSSLVICSNS